MIDQFTYELSILIDTDNANDKTIRHHDVSIQEAWNEEERDEADCSRNGNLTLIQVRVILDYKLKKGVLHV